MEAEVFTNAAQYKRLICALKKAGYRDPPSYREAIQFANELRDRELVSWIERQEDQEQFENLLLLQWEE